MPEINKEQLLLESIIGVAVSRSAGLQVPVDSNLPLKLPQLIHYELYKNHIELHVESSSYQSLCSFLSEQLPNDDVSETVERGFCKYAYILKRRVEGWSNIQELGEAINELRGIVEPVLFRYCDIITDTLELARALGEYYESLKESLPFHINVIDQLHANENAHTRILTQLLKYRENGEYTILRSFLKLIPDFNVESFGIDGSHIYFNRENIDGLIEKEGEYAVIIENKIHWAVDQDKQIERYVETEINHGIPKEHIWVMYLTRDGQKKVEGYSLTDKTAKLLESRFVEMDYRHHVLPWLKDTILPNCKLKEEWLASAIKQYVDHLEGLFGTRESQKTIVNKMQNKIAKSIGCTDAMPLAEKYIKMSRFVKTLNDMQDVVGNYMEAMIKPIVNRLQDETIHIFEEICPEVEIKFYNGLDNGYYQILLNDWPTNVHFEWIPLNKMTLLQGNEYTLTLHVEGNLRDKMRKAFDDHDFCEAASHLGIKTHSDNRTFYKHTINANKSIAEMTQAELHHFLLNAFKDVHEICSFMSKRFLLK